MTEPLVSIIVPTYNVERYIEESVESISTELAKLLSKPYQ